MTYKFIRWWYRAIKWCTHVPQNDRWNDRIMIAHTNITPEVTVLAAELLCPLVQLRLTQGRDGLVADLGHGHANFARDCPAHKRVHGVVPELVKHQLDFMVVRTDVSLRERIEWCEHGRRRLGGRKPACLEGERARRAGVEGGASESCELAQGGHPGHGKRHTGLRTGMKNVVWVK